MGRTTRSAKTDAMRFPPVPRVLPLIAVAGLAYNRPAARPRPGQRPARPLPRRIKPRSPRRARAPGQSPSDDIATTTVPDPPRSSPVPSAITVRRPASTPTARSTLSTNRQLDLALAHGSFRLDLADLDKRFVAVLNALVVDPKTCSATVTVRDTVPVVPGSGTGSYQGIKGAFDLTLTLDQVYRRSACRENGSSTLAENRDPRRTGQRLVRLSGHQREQLPTAATAA